MARVFDEIVRDLDGPAKPGETNFGYLNRSNRIEASRVRALIEDWISNYPKNHQVALIERLRSPIDGAHVSAFFELFLHELMLKTGHTILEIEPRVPHSSHQPDFLVQGGDETRFYLEAVTSIDETQQEVAAKARLNAAIKAVDEINAPLHFLDLEIEGTPTHPVTIRRLRQALAIWISALPTEEADVRNANPFHYEEHGMKLKVSAFLRRTPRQEAGKAIGVQSMPPQWRTPGDGIRESIEKKASRYGALSFPYVVAVNAMGPYQTEEDAVDALFGSPCVLVKAYNDGRTEHRASRNPDGVWQGTRGPRKRGLSAVLSTERLYPWSVGQRRARLIRNPWANLPLPPVPLQIDERNPVDGRLVALEGRSFAEIFSLPPTWPED